MATQVQVVGGRVISGVSKESQRPYEFTALGVVAQGDRGMVVGEIVMDGAAIPAPGRYELVLEPRVKNGRISFFPTKLVPIKA